jgi:hypothetical protein
MASQYLSGLTATKGLHMIPLFVGLPDVALGYFVTAGKNHVKHEERLRVLLGVRHEALERGDPQQDARTFKVMVGALSDIIIESCVTRKRVFLICQKPLVNTGKTLHCVCPPP